MELWIGAEIIR
jgi:hypothetical protein